MHGARQRHVAHAPAALALLVAALLAGACSKGEPEKKAAAPAAPIVVAPKPGEVALDPAAEAALKERLARQEAAAKMFERNVLQPPPPKAAEPKPAPEVPKVAEPPAAAPKEAPKPTVAAAPVEAPKAAPASTAPAAPATQKPASGAAPPPKPASSPAAAPAKATPRTEVASAKPSAAPEPATPRLVSRVEPDFPAEAVRGGVDSGRVLARMTLDGAGRVTNVEIVEAQPRRVFDRSVRTALAQWKFNEGAAGRTVESEIDFRR